MALVLAGAAQANETALSIESGTRRFQFRVEVADTPQERAQGLMFRRELAADAGMLFDLGGVQPITMWMRNTLIPLDMLFIQPDGRISRIVVRAEPLSERSIASGGPVRAVLELRGGTSELLGIRPGDRVLHPLFASP